MKHIQTFEGFLNEAINKASTGYKIKDKIFAFSKSYESRIEHSADDIIAAMGSYYDKPEPHSTGVYNGLWLLKQLAKNTKAEFVACFWTDWNKGDSMTIYLKDSKGFEFRSGYASTQQTWSVTYEILQNAFRKDGKRISSYAYGSYDKIEKIADDIAYMFNEGFKRAYGNVFTNSFYKTLSAESAKAYKTWDALLPAIDKARSELFTAARSGGFRDLIIGRVDFVFPRKRIEFVFNQPRWMRHPDEYGGYDKLLMNKEYETLMQAFNKLSDLLQSAADKLNVELLIAGSIED